MVIEQYGADTLRLYEMFLGPIEASKPWDTSGIEGVNRFLRKLWRLFTTADGAFELTDGEATKAELKTLHKTIKKIREDIENFSFNTAVSAFMVCTNELTDLKCNKRSILEPLVSLLAPFAPHICEELWHQMGNNNTVCDATFPEFDEKHLKEDSKVYPVAFNGKRRYEITVPVDMPKDQVEKMALSHELAERWLEGKAPAKVIVVPNKIVNVVVK